MKPTLKSLLCAGLSVLILAGCAGKRSTLKMGKTTEGEVVEAEGLAPNNPQDLIATKKASLADAQHNAVEKAVGVFVSGRTMVEKAVAIENNILAQTEGYIKKYDVLKEGVEGEFYTTKIRALVALKDLEADLKGMSLLNTSPVTRPRLAVDLSESIEAVPSDDHTAQISFEKSLRDQGFSIVSSTDKKSADLVVTGKVTSEPFQRENLGGFVSYRARVTLQAKRPGGAEIVYSLTKEASGLGGSDHLAGLKALEVVGDFAAQELGTKLSEMWGKGGSILLFVEGVKSFADVERVRKHFLAQPEISDLALRLYDEEMAQFEIQIKSAKVSDLAAHLDTSQSLPMKVLESSGQLIRLKLE